MNYSKLLEGKTDEEVTQIWENWRNRLSRVQWMDARGANTMRKAYIITLLNQRLCKLNLFYKTLNN